MAIQTKKRDMRIDFWRGLALFTIFINHIPGNFYENFTHRNWGVSDSAELFVFLSGFTAAIAYLPRFLAGQGLQQTYKIYRRAGQLYMAHIVSIVIALALFASAAIYFSDSSWLSRINVQAFMNDPVRGIIGIATLGHQLGYFNILPMYITFLAILPLIMVLARKDIMLAVASSFALYVVAQLNGWNMPTYPNTSGWFFNPFAWQLLFTLGFYFGSLYVTKKKVPFHTPLFLASLAYLAVTATVAIGGFWPDRNFLGLPDFISGFDKGGLSLPRIVHLLALSYVIIHLPVNKWLRTVSENNLLVIVGRHALPVFCTGSVLSMAALIIRGEQGGSFLLDTQLIGGGMLIQLIIALVMEWHRRASAGLLAPAPKPAPALAEATREQNTAPSAEPALLAAPRP